MQWGRILTGLYSVFSSPVLDRLAYGMANMRLLSRTRADRDGPVWVLLLIAAPVPCCAGVDLYRAGASIGLTIGGAAPELALDESSVLDRPVGQEV
jgi:hypothetical protein